MYDSTPKFLHHELYAGTLHWKNNNTKTFITANFVMNVKKVSTDTMNFMMSQTAQPWRVKDHFVP